MPYFRGVARDGLGNTVSGASVNVYAEGTTTDASIYTDAALSVTADNPITTNTDGVYEFWVASGIYDFQISASGLTTVNVTDVVIGTLYGMCVQDAASAVVAQSTSYLTISNGTWNAGPLSSGAFSHSDGSLTYLGDAKVIVKVTYSFGITMSVNSDVTFAVEIDGTEVTDTEKQTLINSADAIFPVSASYLVEVEKDEVISIGAKVGSGTPNLTTAAGSSIVVEVMS
jgi:hypothetical protein